LCTGFILLVRLGVETEGKLYVERGRYRLEIYCGSFRGGVSFRLGGGRIGLYLPFPAAILLEVVADVYTISSTQ